MLLVPFKPVSLLPITGAVSLVASVHFTLAVLSGLSSALL